MKHFQDKSTVPANSQFSEAEFEGDRDIDHVAQILSPDIARLLMAYYSGVELKIPKTMHRQHHIALHIGFENACALSEYSNGAELCVPKRSPVSNAARDAQILELVGNCVPSRDSIGVGNLYASVETHNSKTWFKRQIFGETVIWRPTESH